MNNILIETILGLSSGIFLGITGIAPTGLILLAFDWLNIGDYKSNLGTILFINLFPITVGSVFEFYKAKQINFLIGTILLISMVVGSYIGSKFVAGNKNVLSTKSVKYITAYLSLFMGVVFLYSAYYEKK